MCLFIVCLLPNASQGAPPCRRPCASVARTATWHAPSAAAAAATSCWLQPATPPCPAGRWRWHTVQFLVASYLPVTGGKIGLSRYVFALTDFSYTEVIDQFAAPIDPYGCRANKDTSEIIENFKPLCITLSHLQAFPSEKTRFHFESTCTIEVLFLRRGGHFLSFKYYKCTWDSLKPLCTSNDFSDLN